MAIPGDGGSGQVEESDAGGAEGAAWSACSGSIFVPTCGAESAGRWNAATPLN